MDYGDIKKVDTIVSENVFFESRIGEGVIPTALVAPKKQGFKTPKFNVSFFKKVKGKFDIYDAMMIPLGAGIVAAFVMIALQLL